MNYDVCVVGRKSHYWWRHIWFGTREHFGTTSHYVAAQVTWHYHVHSTTWTVRRYGQSRVVFVSSVARIYISYSWMSNWPVT